MFLKNNNNTKLWKIKQKPKAKKKIPSNKNTSSKTHKKKKSQIKTYQPQQASNLKKKTLAQICFMKAFNYPLSRFLRRACRWWRTSKISTPKNIGVWSLAPLDFFCFIACFCTICSLVLFLSLWGICMFCAPGFLP